MSEPAEDTNPTPEEQRFAIAEACGWEWTQLPARFWRTGDTFGFWTSPKGGRINLPDYPHDLNAMHEAEKTIKGTEQWRRYKYELMVLAIDEIHATAAQRAEAFLKTKGLWK